MLQTSFTASGKGKELNMRTHLEKKEKSKLSENERKVVE